MSSVAQASPDRMASRVLVEDSKVCEDGGGFETELWDVRVHNGWMPTAQLVKRKSVGGVTAELLDEDDPSGVRRQRWGGQPPQVYYRRRTNITAPIGTRFRRHVWQPIVERGKSVGEYLRAGDVFPRWRRSVTELELRGDGRLVPVRELEAKRNRGPEQATSPRSPPTKEETRHHAATLLASLSGASARSGPPEGYVEWAPPVRPPATKPREGAPVAGPPRRRDPVRQSDTLRPQERTGKREVG